MSPPTVPPPQNAAALQAQERRTQSTNVALVISALLTGWVLLPLWRPLLFGTVFAAALLDIHRRVTRALGGRRSIAAALLTFATVVLLVAPLTYLVVRASAQAVAALDWMTRSLRDGNLREILRPLPDGLERWLRPHVRDLSNGVFSPPPGGAEAGRWAVGQLRAIVAAVSGFAFELAMMLIALFFVLADGERLVAWLKEVSPIGPTRTDELVQEFRLVARSLVGTNVITGLAQSVVATIGYFIAGTPQPFFFGLVTLLTSFIPTVGTGIVALPLAALLFLSGKPLAAVFLAAWAVLVVGVLDNLLRPWLLKGEVHIHGAVIFFALIGGIILFGFAGLVVGPMAIAFFMTLLRLHARDLRTRVVPVPLPRDPVENAVRHD